MDTGEVLINDIYNSVKTVNTLDNDYVKPFNIVMNDYYIDSVYFKNEDQLRGFIRGVKQMLKLKKLKEEQEQFKRIFPDKSPTS